MWYIVVHMPTAGTAVAAAAAAAAAVQLGHPQPY